MSINIFDRPIIGYLELMARKHHEVPTLSDQIWLLISPFGAFSLSNAEYIEKTVKNLFVVTVDQMTRKIESLHQDAWRLSHTLYRMQASLEELDELTTHHSHPMSFVRLWVTSPYYNYYDAPTIRLLKDMTQDYSLSLQSMKGNTAALDQIKSELDGLRDQLVTSRSMFKDHSIETIIELFRKSGQRVEAKKRKLKRIEDGKRPQSIMLF
jgi:hypothetical protein